MSLMDDQLAQVNRYRFESRDAYGKVTGTCFADYAKLSRSMTDGRITSFKLFSADDKHIGLLFVPASGRLVRRKIVWVTDDSHVLGMETVVWD